LAICSPRLTFIQKMSSVMKMASALIACNSRTTRSGDFSRKVDSWNFQTEQKLHLKGQPLAVFSASVVKFVSDRRSFD
jgi:hypothetical protein